MFGLNHRTENNLWVLNRKFKVLAIKPSNWEKPNYPSVKKYYKAMCVLIISLREMGAGIAVSKTYNPSYKHDLAFIVKGFPFAY
jgi:hypothetical protein